MGRSKRNILILIAFLLTGLSAGGFLFAQEGRTITIDNADINEFDMPGGVQRSRLLGNVQFSHQDVRMSCDSAHFYPELNMFDAFSHVHIWRGDTLDLYGDFLKYKGDVRIAEIRRNVVLDDRETHLTTENIDYDLNKDLGYYFDGGRIVNGENTLVSRYGYYFTRQKLFFFKDSVVVANPDYTMYCDTLKYNTDSGIAFFLGPTDIISDENYIYCENGWYDTQKNNSQFNRNAYLQNKEKILKGDSLYYDRESGTGKGFQNVELIDTAQNIILAGNFVTYEEKTEYALLTDSTLMILVDKSDSLFIHSDTLKSVSDTVGGQKIIIAYNHVKMYRSDLQGKCDSLVYTAVDSVFRFYGDPVLWSEENQLTANLISIETRQKSLYRINMTGTAFIVSMEDSSRFNQIKGRDMVGWFSNNQIYLIDVNGNGQTIYYAKDKGELQGVNSAESATLKIYLTDRKIEKIKFITEPNATYYPLEQFPPSSSKLENFRWLGDYRPVSKMDIFNWR